MTASSRGASLNLLFGLRAHATHRAHRVAVADDVGAYTFGELWDAAALFAGELRGRGTRAGHVVAIAMEGSAAYVAVVLGAMLAGATAAPLNTALTRPELENYLGVIQPEVIVGDCTTLASGTLTASPLEVDRDPSAGRLADRLGIRHAKRNPFTLGLQRPAESPAILFPTGGTTGLPKAAILSHRAVLLWVMSMAGHGHAASGIEVYPLPFFHVGLLTGPISSLHAGAQVIVQRKFDAERVISHIIDDGATRMQTAPTVIRKLRDAPEFDKARVRLRHIRFGGMSSAPEFIDELLEMFPHAQLSTGYGATEFGPVTRAARADFLEGRRTGVGRPVPGVQISIQGEAGAPAPAGVPGDIVVECPWQASGYVGRPEETAATFTRGGVRLADRGSMSDDGWLTLLGRTSDMVITGGENVFPAEVEAVLASHPDVVDVVVVGVPDPTWGERVEAVVVGRPGSSITVDALRTFARGQLAPYKLPRSVRQVNVIPVTPTNKPDRRRLIS